MWSSLRIEGPGERLLLNVISSGNLQRQGLTQLDFESAEPSFDELTTERFFRRFPGGRYEFEIIARATNNNNTAVESCFRVR